MGLDVHMSMPADGVGQILLDAPPRNIAEPRLWEMLDAALSELEEERARVVVIGSSLEKIFVAHGSLERILDHFEGREVQGDVAAQHRVARRLDRGPMVSIAAVDGQAWGGGAELAWSCDLRVASEASSFAQPEVAVGLTPGWGGITKIVHLAGEAAALRLVLDGRPIDAHEARDLGLVHRVVPAREALHEALRWAAWLAGLPTWSLTANKEVVKEIRGLPLRAAFQVEGRAFTDCAQRSEAQDLMRAVVQRYAEGADSRAAFGFPDTGE